jgi:hypothetical protein
VANEYYLYLSTDLNKVVYIPKQNRFRDSHRCRQCSRVTLGFVGDSPEKADTPDQPEERVIKFLSLDRSDTFHDQNIARDCRNIHRRDGITHCSPPMIQSIRPKCFFLPARVHIANRVGGGLSAPVLPHHRTYSSYPAVSLSV